MEEIRQIIVSATENLARRINFHAFWRMVSISMLWGVCIAAALVFVGRFLKIPIPASVAIVLGGSLITGVIRGILARISVLEAAMIADAQLQIKERLASAVELLEDKDISAMAELQLEDAAEYARSLNPKAICPRIFPIAARILPLALLCLIFLICGLSYYDRMRIPAEIRQAIKQAGAEIESLAQGMDRNSLSAEMETVGRELQDEPLTKKEALKNLSNLERKIEALKLSDEIAGEIQGEMTPEKKRLLNELLEKLADNLKDQAFGKILSKKKEELSGKILKAQQAELSADALRELSAALEKMKFGISDTAELKQMSEQVAKSKRDIGQINMAVARAGSREDGTSGLMGDGAPGRRSVKDSDRRLDNASRTLPEGAGYDSELDGQLSNEGRSVSTEIEADIEKGDSTVPYQEIYVEYRDAADDTITRPAIPWAYKEHVKSYFDAIKPKGE